MTISQLIQSSPARANELFAKLAATTNGAVKTRDSLFSELKEELELHARLEEEHLFPTLRKHKEMKDLVREAVADNKQTRALIAELDAMPREGEEFLTKLNELRKAFQQHVRDEKKELLPAVKAALSQEEARDLADRIEAEKEAVEEAKRQEAAQRRAATRREREEAERREAETEEKERRAREEAERRQAEAKAEEGRAREAALALARTGETLVRTGAAAAQAGTEATVRTSGRMAGLVGDVLERTGASTARAVQSYSDTTRPVMDGLQAFVGLPAVAVGAVAETREAWFEWMGRTVENRSRGTRDLLQSASPRDVMEAQGRYFGEAMQAWLDVSHRMLDVSVHAWRGMAKPLERQTDDAKAGRGNG